MAQITELSPLGVPGPKHSFSPKGIVVYAHTGLFTALSPLGIPGPRRSFDPKAVTEEEETEIGRARHRKRRRRYIRWIPDGYEDEYLNVEDLVARGQQGRPAIILEEITEPPPEQAAELGEQIVYRKTAGLSREPDWKLEDLDYELLEELAAAEATRIREQRNLTNAVLLLYSEY